jgi:hypothetical protein
MEVIVERLAGKGTPAHQVWLPPLDVPPNLDELLGGLVTDPTRGVTTANASLRGRLTVPMALVDKPFEQRRDVAWFDLSGAAGHVAFVGNPQSGKSTAVRSLVTALAMTHTPHEVQVYCLDFGGGSLGHCVTCHMGQWKAGSARRCGAPLARSPRCSDRNGGSPPAASTRWPRSPWRRQSDMDATLAS